MDPDRLYYESTHRPELLHPFASAIDEPELQDPETMVSSLSLLYQ